jgi:hypothetical protein
MLTPDEFEALFETFQVSAWRLEIQGVYQEPEEREPLRRWLAGQSDDLGWMADWYSWVRQAVAAGRHLARVRTTTSPLTDYLRWELGVLTPPAIEAGEDIRVLSEEQARQLDIPRTDFWIFDDVRVAVLMFGDAGVLGAELLEQPADVAPFRAIQARAWDAAVSYRDWERSPAP